MTSEELKQRVREILAENELSPGYASTLTRYGLMLEFEYKNKDGRLSRTEQAIYDLMLEVVEMETISSPLEDRDLNKTVYVSDGLEMGYEEARTYLRQLIKEARNDKQNA